MGKDSTESDRKTPREEGSSNLKKSGRARAMGNIIERLCSLLRQCCGKGRLRMGVEKTQSIIQQSKDGEEQIQEISIEVNMQNYPITYHRHLKRKKLKCTSVTHALEPKPYNVRRTNSREIIQKGICKIIQ